jgi:hypothetical protein
MARPDRAEAAAFYFTYIDQIDGDDVCGVLRTQLGRFAQLRDEISEERSLHRYAPGKWSIRQVASHIVDVERLFVFRAFWFARGLEQPLPGFDERVAASVSAADDRSWASHLEEFRSLRAATLHFFQNLPPDAWARRGMANGTSISVNALAFATAGHVAHHLRILLERYS